MLKNFVLETANAPGTSTTFNLGGAASDRLSFSGAGFTNGQLVFYVMDDGAQNEWGIATFNTGSPNTLTRTTVIGNSAGTTAKLNFSGTTNVYNGLPAENTVYADSTGKVVIGGTSTNDDAAAGKVGEFAESQCNSSLANVTITIASPAVITKAGHFLKGIAAVNFGTTGALPTGLATGTVYWTLPGTLPGVPFSVATSIANAIAGTAINTSGTQSGTQSCSESALGVNGSAINVCALSLTAGDWEVSGCIEFVPSGSTVSQGLYASVSTVSATLPLTPDGICNVPGAAAGSGSLVGTGVTRKKLASLTTLYLVAGTNFTVSTMSMCGYLRARRVR